MKTFEVGEINNSEAIPHWDQYFGAWSIMEDRLHQQINALNSIQFHVHAKSGTMAAETAYPVLMAKQQNIGLIEIRGTMTKFGSSLSQQGSTVLARRKLRLALADPEIDAIALVIDSPGGTSAGTAELADDIYAGRDTKPILTYFEDLGASAAYYAGSQASLVRSNRAAFIGSIGTVLVLVDSSQAAENAGLKVHVISTGDFKGAGVPGAEITADQLANFQQLVDSHQKLFAAAVRRGRDMSATQLKSVSDGRVFIAEEAMEIGLIDGIGSFEQSIEELVSLTTSRSVSTMSGTTNPETNEAAKPAMATIDELRSACPGADADFLLKQLESCATVATAQTAWISIQNERLKAEQDRREKAEQEAAKQKQAAAENQLPGNDPLDTETSSEPRGGAIEQWEDAIDHEWKLLGYAPEQKKEAVIRADRKNPELRKQFLTQWRPSPSQVSAAN